MQKMWMIAAVACAALMVSCGGGEKNAKKATPVDGVEQQIDRKAEQAERDAEIVAIAKSYKAEAEAILRSGDSYDAQALLAEVEAWLNTLSKKEKAKAKKILGM